MGRESKYWVLEAERPVKVKVIATGKLIDPPPWPTESWPDCCGVCAAEQGLFYPAFDNVLDCSYPYSQFSSVLY